MVATSASTVVAGRAFVLIEGIDNTSPVLRKVANGLRRLKRHNTTIRSLVLLFQKLNTQVRRLGRELSRVGSALSGKGMGLLFKAGFASMPIVGAINQAKDYSDAMLGLQAVLRATANEMKDLDILITRLGATTSYTAREIAMAAQEMARGGFSRKEVGASLKNVLDLARSGQIDLTTAAIGMVRTLRVFNLTAQESTRVADALFEASRQGTSTLYELQSALAFSSGTAAEMGFTLEETLGVLSKMANSMLVGTRGGTSFNQMLLRMATEADKVREAFGFEVFNASGDPKGALELMLLLSNAVNKLTKEDAIKKMAAIFNVRGKRAASVMAAQFQEIDDSIQAIKNSQGESAKAAKLMDSGIGGTIRRLLSALNNLSKAFGSIFAGSLDKIESTLIPFLEGLSTWIQEHEEWGAIILKVLGGIIALGIAFVALGTALSATGFALGILSALFTGVMAIAPFIAYVGVLIAQLKLLSMLPGNVGKAFSSMLDGVSESFREVWDIVNSVFTEIKNRILAGDIQGALDLLFISLGSIVDISVANWKLAILDFVFYFKELFIEMVSSVKLLWAELQNFLTNKILELVSQNALLNEAFKLYSGVDLRAEIDRSNSMGGNGLQDTQSIVNDRLDEERLRIMKEETDAMTKLADETSKLRDEYKTRKELARKAINDEIKRPWKDKKTKLPNVPGGVQVPTFNLSDYGTGGLGQSVAAGKVSGLEMGSKEALQKAQDNQKEMAQSMSQTASNTEEMLKVLDERLPETEAV